MNTHATPTSGPGRTPRASALATPPLFFLAIQKSIATSPGHLLQLMLLQLSVVALVGLPTYQLALDQIGKLAGHLSLHKIQVSLKSKIMLMGEPCMNSDGHGMINISGYAF